MSKRCTFIALSNQKGGVGKSTMTVLLASYFHYVKGKNVAVIDCDYPQFSIQALRSRDMKNVERSEFLQQLLCRQYERTGKKAYPVLTSGPGKVLETADRLSGNSDILFFDLPGTVNTPGILEAIINMDYVFTPVVQDRMVMQSSLSFVATLRDFIRRSLRERDSAVQRLMQRRHPFPLRIEGNLVDPRHGILQCLALYAERCRHIQER